MPDPFLLLLILCLAAAWVGHACIWTTVLNFAYAKPYPKPILRIWRLITGLMILGFPWLCSLTFNPLELGSPVINPLRDAWSGRVILVYIAICLLFGACVFPLITVYRYRRKPPAILLAETTHTLDLWNELGPEVVGNGKGRLVARLPFNCIYRMDFTEIAVAIPDLPREWEGLTILHLSDIHFHGTPSRAFFERVMAQIESRWPKPDLVCLTGDFVDTDEHHTWISPLLGRFRGIEGNFAILGNHDKLHKPDQVRSALAEAGYTVLGNGWQQTTIRGVPCLFIGHEGPWFRPPPNLAAAPTDLFRICLSHTPDYFYWGQANHIKLMLCGHVHGGQIRLPVISSIFVPSVYGRRFDMGVFEKNGLAMVVNRGLSGKEPLRFRCHPQVLWITLRRS